MPSADAHTETRAEGTQDEEDASPYHNAHPVHPGQQARGLSAQYCGGVETGYDINTKQWLDPEEFPRFPNY